MTYHVRVPLATAANDKAPRERVAAERVCSIYRIGWWQINQSVGTGNLLRKCSLIICVPNLMIKQGDSAGGLHSTNIPECGT